MEQACSAAGLLDFLVDLPLLLPQDKKGVLKLIKSLDPSGLNLIARSGHHGISVFRTAAARSSNNIYRVTGMGEVAADPRDVFELLCNWGVIPEWDVLFKSGRYLSYARDPAGRCEVAYIHIVYGLPGVSKLVSDRDFVLRTVRVFLPNGMCVLFCHSTAEEHIPGDPGPLPHMIRGHMWDSGYVVVPTSAGCCVSVTLQVDPKGWIPTSVINWSLEAIPLNIQRVRAAVERLGPAMLALLPESNMQQGAACSKRPTRGQLGRLPVGWTAADVGDGAAGAVRHAGSSSMGCQARSPAAATADGAAGDRQPRCPDQAAGTMPSSSSSGSVGSARSYDSFVGSCSGKYMMEQEEESDVADGVQWFDALG